MGAVAEPGRDAVDRNLLGDQRVLQVPARADRVGGAVREPDRVAATRYLDRVGDRQAGAVELEQRLNDAQLGLSGDGHEMTVPG